MTGSSPQAGDSETHDDTSTPKPSRGASGATQTQSINPTEAISGDGAATETTPNAAVEASREAANTEDGSADDDDKNDKGDAKGKVKGDDEDDDEEEEDDDDDDSEEEEDDSEEEEDEEPKLKYARLTQHLGPVYRNGDATSTFIVAGDKTVGSPHPEQITPRGRL